MALPRSTSDLRVRCTRAPSSVRKSERPAPFPVRVFRVVALGRIPEIIPKRQRRTSDGQPSTRRRRITAPVRAEVVDLYRRGASTRQVAEQTRVSRTTVLDILKKEGVQVRPQGRRR
ncbi:helix-turn-helix domain-containing protein [Gordonia sp. (in: high G+C Gram-positive bacteria)]|uniref:helix-turn-helix domain-containing protein n=1 Tax=Gordonia sp. (in: high G+C Gram-positive bacteria) TaxID=84139 RepID=UPI0039E6ED63